MKRKLHTLLCTSAEDIQKFFDASAPEYKEQHGNAENLFRYRLSLIKHFTWLTKNDVLLDLGCGTGNHLFALAPFIKRGIGIDFSPKMIEIAQQNLKNNPEIKNITFQIDQAQMLTTIPDQSIDIVIAIGAFEHMPQKKQVLHNIYRILKIPGRLLFLTPNGNFLWYRSIAPLFHIPTRHLSTDEFVTANWMKKTLEETGFTQPEFNFWTFIPRGDMSWGWATLLTILDFAGKLWLASYLRSGLIIRATKIK